MLRRLLLASFLASSLLGFTAQVFTLAAERQHPVYDEGWYLALARSFKNEGGFWATVACHFAGTCGEDARNPLYSMLQQFVVSDAPVSYPNSKLVTYVNGLMLLALSFYFVRRRFNVETATASVVLLCLSPAFVLVCAEVLQDVLFACFLFLVVYGFAMRERTTAPWHLAAGVVIGLAQLSKASGFLVLTAYILMAIYRDRLAGLRRPAFLLAGVGFCIGASFLLYRNWVAFGSPMYNFNNHAVWLDQWRDSWVLYRTPIWQQMNLSWYVEQHSFSELVVRTLEGFSIGVGMFVYGAAVGPHAVWARWLTGSIVTSLAVWSMWRRYRAGRKLEVLALVTTLGLFFLAFSLYRGMGIVPVRFVLPLNALVIPFAAERLLALGSWLTGRDRPRDGMHQLEGRPRRLRALQLGALALVGIPVLQDGEALTRDPRRNVLVEQPWAQLSSWINRTLKPTEKIAIPYHSHYTNWDSPRPDPYRPWQMDYAITWPLISELMERHNIATLLVDLEDRDFAEYRDKLSPEADRHGPLRFCSWTRCFHDDDTPSRFLVYCRPESPAAPSGYCQGGRIVRPLGPSQRAWPSSQ
jgi:hypothetical protein